MKIKKEIQISLTPKDVKELIFDHFLTKGIKLTSIYFNVGGHEAEGDWRSEFPLDYRLDEIQCTGEEE